MSSFIERVRSIPRGIETIREWLGSEDGIPVSPELAQRRADICLQCPQNQPGGFMSEIVAAALKRHLELKSDLGMRVKGERKLFQCQVCLCQLSLKIHVPIGIVRRQMPASEYELYPVPCWQRDEKP